MIEEILKKLRNEQERVNAKFIKGFYSVNDYRARYFKIEECIDIVLEVAEKEHTEEEISKLIKECLID